MMRALVLSDIHGEESQLRWMLELSLIHISEPTRH